MMGLAYSYLRFSTPQQMWGDSRRRQIALAVEYADRHGLKLDEGLNFRDLGVSAFRSKNARAGGLRSFLDAVEYGLVPANSFLLVESLDRLSRDQILDAQALFLQIIRGGVTIVTLIDQRSYSTASLNANPTDLIISLVYMMRANEESMTKSIRCSEAWTARRDRRDITFHGGQCPAWLKANAANTGYEVIPEKAAIVQRIYRESLEGIGLLTIVKRLQAEGVPLLGGRAQRGKTWQRALLRHYLRTPLVIGTYIPCRPEMVDGKRRYLPTEPRLNYYPAIISLADFEAVQRRRSAWSTHYKCRDRTPQMANVLARLSRCSHCDRPLVLQRCERERVNQRYLVCVAYRDARVCSNAWIRYPDIEYALTNEVRFVIAGCPQPILNSEGRRAMLKRIAGRLRQLRLRQGEELAVRDTLASGSRPGRTWSDETQKEISHLLAERYQLRLDRNYWVDATLAHKLERLRCAVLAEPRDLVRINEAYRLLLEKVVVDGENFRLIMHWRHGRQSIVDFCGGRMKKGARNPTPSDAAMAEVGRRWQRWANQTVLTAETAL